ncbi:MAG: hypothetical protein AAGA56_17895 [Myxococcota bacterium]
MAHIRGYSFDPTKRRAGHGERGGCPSDERGRKAGRFARKTARRRDRFKRGSIALGLTLILVGCGDDDDDDDGGVAEAEACAALATVCAQCPLEGDGGVARSSCESVVEEADGATCKLRLEERVYRAFGCRD